MKTTIYTLLLIMALSSMGYSQTNQTIKAFDNAVKHIQAIEKYNNMDKQSASNKQVLDSIIERPNLQQPSNFFTPTKEYFLYNEFGKDTLVMYYDRQTNNDPWLVSGKKQNIYNSKNQLIASELSLFDNIVTQWENYLNQTYTYDTNNRISSYSYGLWDDDSVKYITQAKYLFDYDSQGNIIKQTSYTLAYNADSLVPSDIRESIYNNQSLLILAKMTFMNPITNTWITGFKDTLEYTIAGKVKKKTTIVWNDINSSWDTSIVAITTYDSSNYPIEEKEYKYEQASWVLFLSITRSYNTLHDTMQIINYRLDTATQQMLPEQKSTHYFDQQQHRIKGIYSIRDINTNTWKYTSKDSISYDLNYSSNDVIYPVNTFIAYLSDNMLLNYSTFTRYPSLPNWEAINNTTYYYSTKTITEINKASQESISVYPNPTSDYIHFDIPLNNQDAQIEVFDITGKLIYQASLENDKTLSVNRFDKGLYLFRIVSQNKIYSGKFMVE